jgi:hypothetical protein
VTRLTHDRILQLCGRSRLDDHSAAEILRTGASEPELVEAILRATRAGEIGTDKRRAMSRTVAKLCEILATTSDDLAEPD